MLASFGDLEKKDNTKISGLIRLNFVKVSLLIALIACLSVQCTLYTVYYVYNVYYI